MTITEDDIKEARITETGEIILVIKPDPAKILETRGLKLCGEEEQ